MDSVDCILDGDWVDLWVVDTSDYHMLVKGEIFGGNNLCVALSGDNEV